MPFRKFSFKDLILITFCILFTAILYYRDFAVVDLNKFYLVIATFGVAAILDYKRVIYLLCFLFPLSCGIPSNFIYPLLICILFIKDPQKSLNKVMLFIVIFLMEISHYGFYTFDTQIAEVVGYASFLFLMFYIIADNQKDVDSGKCITIFCIGAAVLLLGIIINNTILISQLDPINGIMRLGDNKELGDFEEARMMLTANANTIGYYSIAAISCLLVLQYYKKINSILFLILFAVSFYGGVLSVSRTWAILMIISVIIYLRFMKHNIVKSLLLIGVLSIGVVVFLSQDELILEFFTQRFTEDSTNLSTAGGRTIIFQEYNAYLADNPLSLIWGEGAVYYKEASGIAYATHNALQQIIVSYGLVGLCIFICAFIRSTKKYFSKKELMAILPLCMMVLFVQTIQILNPYFLMAPIIVAFYALKMGKSQSQLH